jgi:putative addiction module component (TIGR02574 family)
MRTYDSLLLDASHLPVPLRIQLIEALWDTVPEDSLPPLSEEWLAEIAKRSAEFDAEPVSTVPWEKVRLDAVNRIAPKVDE